MVNIDRAKELVAYLNHLHKEEPFTIQRLVSARVQCGAPFSKHATLQVVGPASDPHVGFLGVLNGYCGTYEDGPYKGFGPVMAQFDSKGVLTGFGLTHEIDPKKANEETKREKCMRCEKELDSPEGFQTGICADCWTPEDGDV
jgi:hypothetical protein